MANAAGTDWKALIAVLSDLLADRIGLVEGCRRVAALRHKLRQDDNELFLPFVAVDSDTLHFPIGRVRECWSAKALDREDRERAQYERDSRADLIAASERLLQYAWKHAL